MEEIREDFVQVAPQFNIFRRVIADIKNIYKDKQKENKLNKSSQNLDYQNKIDQNKLEYVRMFVITS